MRVLSINCGSSSLKYAVFEAGEHHERELHRAEIERIGTTVPDHAAAVRAMVEALVSRDLTPDAVGHRIVHGGADRTAPREIDGALLAALEALVPFAPLHLPPEIRAVRAVTEHWPAVRQVACFDTAFHATISEAARHYAIPQRLHDAGIRKYGFHGLSYEYVVSVIGAAKLGRAVVAHLGAGASMAAVRDGRCVDTTMGFTPSAGLVMGTRSGDIDPGLMLYLVDQGYDGLALDRVVNREGGLLGVSGSTADVRDLLSRRAADPRAALALDVFTWSARRWIGALAATLGGIDSLVFTGGIGEHASAIRAEIARGLEHLGVAIDASRNEAGAAIISPDRSTCTVHVTPTDEERIVARHARRTLTVH